MHDGSDDAMSATDDVGSQFIESQNSSKCDREMIAATTTMVAQPMTNDKSEFKFLYLFSGPKKQAGGFENHCMNLGIKCRCIDVEYDPAHDLLCQDFWNEIENEVDDYDAYLLSPPCSTFTMARTGNDGGPSPLRGLSGRDRYGLRNLSVEDKKKVKEGTLLFEDSACSGESCQHCQEALDIRTTSLEGRWYVNVHA